MKSGVTQAMLEAVLNRLREDGHQYLVAPYEADAQLAYLQRNGLIDGVLTLDGDLFLYGATEVVLDYHLETGSGLLHDLSAEAQGTASKKPDPSFNSLFKAVVKWGPCVTQIYAALVGCDYFEKGGVHGIGPETADKILSSLGKRETALPPNTLPQLTAIRHAIMCNSSWDEVRLTAAMEHVEKVLNVYQHQVIYDPRTKTNRPLSHADTPIVSADQDPPGYCGFMNRFVHRTVTCIVLTPVDAVAVEHEHAGLMPPTAHPATAALGSLPAAHEDVIPKFFFFFFF